MIAITAPTYKVVYSLYEHSCLGFLLEPHVVQLNAKGNYTLSHKKLYSSNANDFLEYLDQTDFQLIKLLEECEQKYIAKKYCRFYVSPEDFFTKYYNKEMHDVVRTNIERRLAIALKLLKDTGKEFFIMGKSNNPTWQKIKIYDNPATVLFHFRKNNGSIRYFPTIKCYDVRIDFVNQNANIICSKPVWLLIKNALYFFDENLDGKKLHPFLSKPFIDIPKDTETHYLKSFVMPLIEQYNVATDAFQIITQKYKSKAILKIITLKKSSEIGMQLLFKYGDDLLQVTNSKKVSVKLVDESLPFTFLRIRRNNIWEQNIIKLLHKLGVNVDYETGFCYLQSQTTILNPNQNKLLGWLQFNFQILKEHEFEIHQDDKCDKLLNLAIPEIIIDIKEHNDWFDLHATVKIGSYEFPFIELRNHILNNIKEFKLPSGEIAVIPDEWFGQFQDMFTLSQDSKKFIFKKHHIGFIHHIQDNKLAELTIRRKLESLINFEKIEEIDIPGKFIGNLRPYQKAGYDWFCFLNKWKFGGCLADDMGLGKTIQTLIMLQKCKDDKATSASVIIMPTSLIHNWLNEAKRFTPKLKILCFTGSDRIKKTDNFNKYDVILTTYRIVRIDKELLQQHYFNYIILDESQMIKNPQAQISRVVKSLKSQHKLILTGTPIENSTMDIWSQMSFINPGLLGNQTYFREQFVLPIEKEQNESKQKKLQAIIKPFILRRTKEQVEKELPPKMEYVQYCTMTEDQEKYYEKTKSYYRNQILNNVAKVGFAKSKISIFEGLIKLRQIAIHPKLVDINYKGQSGKFDEIIRMLDSIIAENHKVLLFSQFVKQLTVFKEYFEKIHTPFCYLDGSTKNRREVIKVFQTNDNIKLFLISLKAGGVGINLTAADYVFITDPWWNPAVEQQAIDRTHRIGQVKPVFTYKFITKNSVEEKILTLQQKKSSLAKKLITTQESFIKTLSIEDIKAILT